MKNGLRFAPDIEVGRETVSAPSFAETVGASLAYKYNPMLDFIKETYTFGSAPLPEDGYNARENIPEDLKPYGSSLLSASNQQHMDFKINSLREGLKTRETNARSGLGVSFAAEIFDPVNFISIPLRFTTLGATALRSGLQTSAVVGAQEAIRAPIDPLATTSETAINVGSAFALGTFLGTALSAPAARRASAIQRTEVEIENLRQAIEPLEGVEIDPSIATSAFTDSWLFKSVTTPMKRVLQDETVPNSVKLTMLDIANDAGILLNANKQGFAIKNSVFQNAKLRDGEWVQTYDEIVSIWGESQGSGVVKPLDYMYKRSDFEEWLTEVDSKAMRGQKPANDFEAKAMDQLNNFYSKWESRLSERGLIGNKGFYIRDIDARQKKIDNINSSIERYRGTPEYTRLKGIVDKNSDIIKQHKSTLEEIDAAGPTSPANEEIFRPRYWDKDAIAKDRSGLEKILADWFRQNPDGYGRNNMGKYVKTTFSTDEDAIAKRASDAVDSILGLRDVTDLDVASFGYGKSKHLKHRGIDIPNKLVLDYMHRNPVSIMKAYTARTAAKYEFSVKFDGQEIDDVIDDKMSEMIQSGMTVDQANAAAKDIRHMYDRVAGTVIREPDTMNQKAAEVLRTAAQLGYLGKAGLSTISEPAKIMMEHGIGKTMKGLFSVLSDSQLKMGAKEARIAGEALEILMGSSHLRLVDDMGNNPLRSNFMDKSKNAFYALNGLAPITRIFKDFDGMMRSHTLIDYSVRWTQGKASKMEQEYLLRYGIDLDTAGKIANAPWQKSESGMYMANTEAWTNTIEFPSTTAEIVTGPTNTFQLKKVKRRIVPEKGFARKDIVDYLDNKLEGYDKGSDLAFHATSSPKQIIDEGFEGGGATIDYPHFDYGYGDYIAVFDIRDVKKKFNIANSENLKTKYRGRAMEPEHDSKFASDMYGDASFALEGQKPIAVIHVSEIPEFSVSRSGGARAEEEGMTGIEALEVEFFTELEYYALKGDSKGIKELSGFDIFYGDSSDPKEIARAIAEYQDDAKVKAVFKDYKPLENVYEEVTENGRYKPAFYRRSENKVYIDEDYIRDVMWQDRGWENPRVEGVNPIKAGVINTPDDYVTFIKMHEIMHTLHSSKSLGFDKRTKKGLAAYENAINDLAVAEIEKQARVTPETVQSFRSALSSGIANTILMGTPADKPIITDGVAYIPMHVAGKFGMKEDSKYTGYARIENGLLGLPFQFYSYALAATNKTLAAYGHGQLKNRFLGTAIAMGLGYMTLELKTPDFVELSPQDKFARAFDFSGVAALHSDLFYTAMSTSLALGGPNITGGALQPRYPQEPSVTDAVTGLLGAGPSIGMEYANGMANMLTGNIGEGSKEFIRALPFSNIWMWNDFVNRMTRMLESELDDGPSGFGRY